MDDKQYNVIKTNEVLHKTCGLLNFLGGVYTIEELESHSFAEVVHSLISNGCVVKLTLSKEKFDEMA